MKNKIAKQLGFKPVDSITKAVCRQRIKIIKKGLKANKYKGSLRPKAIHRAAFYKWQMSTMKKAA